jgi:nucleoside-diphosphate-sugar epimerase
MSEHVLITGATGFVGSHIAATFVEAGYGVRCGVRASSNTRWVDGLRAERVIVGFDRPGDLTRAVEGVDAVVHAAGLTRARRTSDYHLVNAEGTRRLAGAALEAGVKRFVLISSLAARGPDASSRDGLDHPTSAYGRSKVAAEGYLRRFGDRMEIVALRPAGVYGPRDTDFLPLIKLARSGWLILPYGPGLFQPVYVADVARAVLAAASREAVGFGPFPVAEPTRYTWRRIVAGLEAALEHPVRTVRLPAPVFELSGRVSEWAAKPLGTPPVFDERRARDLAVHAWTCDPSSAEQALGWRTEVPLTEGLRRTAQWYRQAGWL